MSATVVVTWAGVPIVAPHASSSMSTTAGGQALGLLPELVRHDLLDREVPPEDVPDDAHLLCLAERL